MPIAALTTALNVWLWLCIFQAGVLLFQSGPQPRVWFLLLSAFSAWASLWLFERYSDPDDGPLRPRRIKHDDRPEK